MVVVDEVSMSSNLNLAYMHLRLGELFGGDEYFEHAIWRRYPPIPPRNGMPVFETVSKAAIIHKLGCVTSINIYKAYELQDESARD